MLTQIKRLTKHSIVYGISNILGRTLNFFLLPLYTNYLPPQEFGYYSILYAYIIIATVLMLYGIDSAFLRFYLLEKDQQKQKEIISESFLTLTVSTILLTALLLLFSEPLARFIFKDTARTDLILWASGILFFDVLSALGYLYLRAKEKSLSFALIKLGNILVTISGNLFLIIGLHWGIKAVFVSNCIASALSFLVLIPFFLKNFQFSWKGTVTRELLKFGIPFLPATLAVMIIEISDRIIMQHLTNAATVGIYQSGYTLSRFMSMFVGMFLFAWQPFSLQISDQPDAKKIYSRVLTYFTFIAGIIYLGLVFFVEDLMKIKIPGTSRFLIGEKFWLGTQVIPLVALGYICYGWYVTFLPGIQIEKKTYYLPYITGLGAIVNILTNVICIPIWGMQGAAFATFLAYLVMAVSLYLVNQRIYPVPVEWPRVLTLILLFLLITLVGKFWWVNLWLRLLLVVSIPGFLMLFKFFNKGEWKYIQDRLASVGLSRPPVNSA